MLTKDEFITKYIDEMTGLLLAAFTQVDATSHHAAQESYAKDGKFMIAQQRRAKVLLSKLYDDLSTKPVNGQPRTIVVDTPSGAKEPK